MSVCLHSQCVRTDIFQPKISVEITPVPFHCTPFPFSPSNAEFWHFFISAGVLPSCKILSIIAHKMVNLEIQDKFLGVP